MLKFLMLCVILTTIHSESVEWFSGRWLPVVMYSNQITNITEEWIGWRGDGWIALWTGGLLEAPECGWLEVNSTNQLCTCGDRNVPLMLLRDFENLNTYNFYEFHMDEPRPIIMVDTVDEVETALTSTCMCGDEEMTQLVFRKTSGNYLMSYENREKKKNSPNMTLVMVKYVPDMSEIYDLTKYPSSMLDIEYQKPTLMCDPTFFDDSAYVMDSSDNSENDSPFFTLHDLKNYSDELLNQSDTDVESSTTPSLSIMKSSTVSLHLRLGSNMFQLMTILLILR